MKWRTAMNNNNVDYKITASLLNSFDWYLHSNSENAEQDLLNTINRASVDYTEAQAKGVAFEHIINLCIAWKFQSINLKKEVLNVKFECGEQKFIFEYPTDVIIKIAGFLLHSKYVYSQQYFVQKNIEIANNKVVELCGFIDYLSYDTIIDLKTTSNYWYPKYHNNWQKYVYAYCLLESATAVEFAATDFKELYTEHYEIADINFEDLKLKLEHFIIWLDANKEKITDKKIFGGENDYQEKRNPIISIISEVAL